VIRHAWNIEFPILRGVFVIPNLVSLLRQFLAKILVLTFHSRRYANRNKATKLTTCSWKTDHFHYLCVWANSHFQVFVQRRPDGVKIVLKNGPKKNSATLLCFLAVVVRLNVWKKSKVPFAGGHGFRNSVYGGHCEKTILNYVLAQSRMTRRCAARWTELCMQGHGQAWGARSEGQDPVNLYHTVSQITFLSNSKHGMIEQVAVMSKYRGRVPLLPQQAHVKPHRPISPSRTAHYLTLKDMQQLTVVLRPL